LLQKSFAVRDASEQLISRKCLRLRGTTESL
jgi:hypothetical protein